MNTDVDQMTQSAALDMAIAALDLAVRCLEGLRPLFEVPAPE